LYVDLFDTTASEGRVRRSWEPGQRAMQAGL